MLGARRQVPEAWRYEYRGWVYGFAYGALLGLAFVTIVPVSTTYVTFAAAGLSQSLGVGALIGATFGVARAAALFGTRRIHDGEALRRWLASLVARKHRSDRIVRVAQGAVLALSLAAAASAA
jgi:hypothetical protein